MYVTVGEILHISNCIQILKKRKQTHFIN